MGTRDIGRKQQPNRLRNKTQYLFSIEDAIRYIYHLPTHENNRYVFEDIELPCHHQSVSALYRRMLGDYTKAGYGDEVFLEDWRHICQQAHAEIPLRNELEEISRPKRGANGANGATLRQIWRAYGEDYVSPRSIAKRYEPEEPEEPEDPE